MKSKIIILYFITFALFVSVMILTYKMKEKLDDSIKYNVPTKLEEIDSLKSELFILQTNIQRYEIMMEKVKEEDSLLYEKVMFETE